MRDLILVLEIGSLRVRALAVNQRLVVENQTVAELDVYYPQAGWFESNPEAIWLAALKAMQHVVRNVGEERFAGLAIANQRDTLVLWERVNSRAIYPAINGEDQRVREICAQFRNSHRHPMVHYRTGLFVEPHSPAMKIAWILEHVPQAQEKAKRGELAFGCMDTWIIWNLTRGQVHATDSSNAARTLLFDINSHQWEPQLLATFGIPAAILPAVLKTGDTYGQTQATTAGFSLPIVAVANSLSAELNAHEDPTSRSVRLHVGRSFVLQLRTGYEPLASTNLQTILAWKNAGKSAYALEASIEAGGTVIQWLKDGLGLVQDIEQIEKDARSVQDSEGVYFVPALTGLGTPYQDATARGTILGITYKTTGKHIIRAALEGLAYQIADNVELLKQVSKSQIQQVRVDGSLVHNAFLMQCIADVSGLPVECSVQDQIAALGMAGWAGSQIQCWPQEEQMPTSAWQMEQRFEPLWAEKVRQKKNYLWQTAIERAKAWQTHETNRE